MQSGYYDSAAGMVTQFNRLDTIANNLANVNTAGFKEDSLVVGDFMRIFKEARDELPNANQSEDGAAFINRTMNRAPQIVDAFTNYSVGNMQKTDNPLDFALSREGLFFVVDTPQGVRLTRNGSFTKSDEGKLVTKEGFEVLPSDYLGTNSRMRLDREDSVIEVDKNGQIYTNIQGTVKLTLRSKFFIVQPENIQLLEKEGANLYKYEKIASAKSLEESGAVRQGFIEKSNVNAVHMMTQMIETNRLVGMYQKVMDSQMNDMNRDAITKIAAKA